MHVFYYGWQCTHICRFVVCLSPKDLVDDEMGWVNDKMTSTLTFFKGGRVVQIIDLTLSPKTTWIQQHDNVETFGDRV